jgi:chromate transport protein ChrA
MKFLYDELVQFFSGVRWTEFIAQSQRSGNPETAISVKLTFQQDNYLMATFLFIIAGLAAMVYYYFILNRKKGSGYGYKFKYWLVTLVVIVVLAGILTGYLANLNVQRFHISNILKFSVALGLTNAIYTGLLFFLLSIIFKKFSVANKTPF